MINRDIAGLSCEIILCDYPMRYGCTKYLSSQTGPCCGTKGTINTVLNLENKGIVFKARWYVRLDKNTIGPYKPSRFKNNTFIIILKHFQK